MAMCFVKSCVASQSQAQNKQKLDTTRVEVFFRSKGVEGAMLSGDCVRSDYNDGPSLLC